MQAIATDIYDRTCRNDFEAPGFSVLNVGHADDEITQSQQREFVTTSAVRRRDDNQPPIEDNAYYSPHL